MRKGNAPSRRFARKGGERRGIGRPFVFFALVYLLTLPWWVLSRFVSWGGLPDNLPVTDAAATFMPALAAMLIVGRQKGLSGVKALLARPFDWRSVRSPGWLIVIKSASVGLCILTYLLMQAAGAPAPTHWALTPQIAFALLAFLIAAAGEELSYTGYATDLLLRR